MKMTTTVTDRDDAETLFESIMSNYLSERKKQIAELDKSGLKDKDPKTYGLLMQLIENKRPIFCDLTTGKIHK